MNKLGDEGLIARIVHGFEGYQEKERRNRSNRALLEHLSIQLVCQVDRVASFQIELAGMGLRRECAELDRGVLRLQALADATAALRDGSAPWLALPHLEQEDAEVLYRMERRLLSRIDIVAERVNSLEGAVTLRTSLAKPIGELATAVDVVAETLAVRQEIITNLTETNIG